MACCIIAAYLWGILMARLRHRLAYWGLVEPLPWDDRGTIWRRGDRRPVAPPQP